MREVNQAGIDLIKASESLRLRAYDDGGGVPSIGFGHTQGVRFGDRISAEQADMLLASDLGWASTQVEKLVDVEVNDNQFAALVSLVFNIGAERFAKSTLLRKLNSGDIPGASREFSKWVYDNGRILKGLVIRRQKERALFDSNAPE